jgi:hypothetical protein
MIGPDIAAKADLHVSAIYGASGYVKRAEADPAYSVEAADRRA